MLSHGVASQHPCAKVNFGTWEDAARNAIIMAKKKYSDLRVATVKELDMTIEGEMVKTFRAKVSLSFKYHP